MVERWGKKKDKKEEVVGAEEKKEEVVEAVVKPEEGTEEKEEEVVEEVVEEEEERDLSDVAVTLTRSEAIVSELSYHGEVMNPERYDALRMAALSMEFLTVDDELLKLFYDYVNSREEAERKIIDEVAKEKSTNGNKDAVEIA